MTRHAVRLNHPHIFCDALIAVTPTRKRARVINIKNASEAQLCGRPVVRGNMPVAEIEIEPRTRLTTPNCPSNRLDGRLFPRPMAKTRLSTPVKISPELNNAVADPSTPRTLKWFSVQLNQGELEIVASRAVRPMSWEVMPEAPAMLLSTATLPESDIST